MTVTLSKRSSRTLHQPETKTTMMTTTTRMARQRNLRAKLRKTKPHNVGIAYHDEPEALGHKISRVFAYTTLNGACAGESAIYQNMEKEKEDILIPLNSLDGAQKAEAERKAESLSLRILNRAANFENAQFTKRGKKGYKHAKDKRRQQITALVTALDACQQAMKRYVKFKPSSGQPMTCVTGNSLYYRQVALL
jgi:hypothetical protein